MTPDQALLEQARSPDADVRQRAAARLGEAELDSRLTVGFDLLGDKDWRVRKTVVDALLQDPSDQVIRGLLAALHDAANAGKRNSATEALVRLGEPVVPFVILELGREAEIDVRLSLVNLLGDLRSLDAFQMLVALLGREQDINLLSSIVSSIGKYRDSAAIDPLLKTLTTKDLWLKFHVVEALGEIGDRRALPAVLPLYSEKALRKPVLEAIGKIGDSGTVGFLTKVIAEEEKLNLVALRALALIADAERPRVVESGERLRIQRGFRESFPASKLDPLIEHLRTTHKAEVKNFILKFLGWSGEEKAIEDVLSHLWDPACSEAAARALVDMGPITVPSLLAALQRSEEDEITTLLMRVVSAVGGRQAAGPILSFVDHDNPSVRRAAVEMLGEILEPTSIDYLLAKLDDSDVATQQAAVNSIISLVEAYPEVKGATLRRIRKLLASPSTAQKLNSLSIFVHIQGEGYPDELLLASKDQDPVIRQKAISLMGRFADERFADQLVLSLADEATVVRVAAIEAIVKLRPEKGIQPLLSSLGDPDIWIRTAAAQALGGYRRPEVIELLVRHIESDATPVKIAAIESLGRIESREALSVLLARFEDEDPEIRRAAILAVAKIPGDEITPRLIETLRDPDWRLRAAAAVSLGARGAREALSELHGALLGDPDPYVQQSAVVALDKIGDRESFSYLLGALSNRLIRDDVADLLVRHRETYRDLLEAAWSTADRQHEQIIAAILEAQRK